MNLKAHKAAVSTIAMVWAVTGQAGDTPLYETAPKWIESVDFDEIEADESNDLIVFDQQIRIEEGQHWEYQDQVFRISGLTDLANVGTLKAQWLPDKGDLIIHEVSIFRDGAKIDVLDGAGEFEVLRRERMLERGILDGSLTATMAVPGLEVGDQLRFRYSVTNSDQALGNEVQSQSFLWREQPRGGRGALALMGGSAPGSNADFSRVAVSWPQDLDVRYKAGRDFEIGEPEKRNGYNWLSVTMPLPEADPIPPKSPLRYRQPNLLQASTFADWAEVSSTMAPYYKVENALDGLDDLQSKIDRIAAAPTSELEKAVDALELVQEDIRYLLNGLDGGNYLPQDVATTWESKYGDCKAKTVLLLAVLKRLGVQSEAVLVSTNRGNLVPTSLPLPGAFNHVLVRALIGGQEYFLDGTSIGANMRTVGNVPPFEFYLPIRDENASIEPLLQTLARVPEREMHVTVDASAGLDMPSLGTVRVVTYGAGAAQLNSEREKFEDVMKGGMGSLLGRRAQLTDFSIEPGEDDSELIVIMKGVMPSLFKFDGLRGEYVLNAIPRLSRFSPDRSKAEWREIPVAVGEPGSDANTITLTLPFEASNLVVKGKLDLEAEAAGKAFTRRVQIAGRDIDIFEQFTNLGGEIAPDRIREERRKAARLAGEKLTFTTPTKIARRWRFAGNADRSALQPLEDAYAKSIANEPDESQPLIVRARFRRGTYDYVGAAQDYSAAIELEATPSLYEERANIHLQLRDLSAAKADFEEAYLLDPTPQRAIRLAESQAKLGEVDSALELLEGEGGDTKARQRLASAIAELEAIQGNPAAGLERISIELADDPNDGDLLNAKCWFIATWEIALEEGADACRLAVERGENAAQALDSRALHFLRVGALEEARADIEQALELSPWQEESLMLRGFIKLGQGDASGKQDISEAITRRPAIVDIYSRWGFEFEVN